MSNELWNVIGELCTRMANIEDMLESPFEDARDMVQRLQEMRETATLRDQFAMAALTGAITNTDCSFEQRAEWCYLQADAMLAARSGKGEG